MGPPGPAGEKGAKVSLCPWALTVTFRMSWRWAQGTGTGGILIRWLPKAWSHLLDCHSSDLGPANLVPLSSTGISRSERSHWAYGTSWCQCLWASGKGPFCIPHWGCCWDYGHCCQEEGTGLTLPVGDGRRGGLSSAQGGSRKTTLLGESPEE